MTNTNEYLAKFIDIGFIADDSQEAAKWAIEDALGKKNKMCWRGKRIFSWKNALHGSATMDKAAETYNKVFDAVLQAKAAKAVFGNNNEIFLPENQVNEQTNKTEIINNQQINSNNMSKVSKNTFRFQMELAEDLKKYLRRVQEDLAEVAERYNKKYNNLGNVMMEEFHEEFCENYSETIKIISNLVKQIDANDIPHVDSYIKKLEPLV